MISYVKLKSIFISFYRLLSWWLLIHESDRGSWVAPSLQTIQDTVGLGGLGLNTYGPIDFFYVNFILTESIKIR